MLIEETNNIKHVTSNTNSIVHGSLFKWLFNQEIDARVVGTGFAYVNGEWKFNSYSIHTSADPYHDREKGMSKLELEMVQKVIEQVYKTHRWRTQPNIDVVEILSANDKCTVCGKALQTSRYS